MAITSVVSGQFDVEAKADGDCIGKWFRGDRRRTTGGAAAEKAR